MKSQRGFSLIETIVALALVGTVCVALITGLGVASKTMSGADAQETAKDLAIAQMEYVQNQTYDNNDNPPVYQVLPNIATQFPGFSVATPMAERLDDSIQKITIEVNQGGKTVYTLTGEKVKW